jgi:DNA-binding transcriptional regulator LsrR (DeoR family)
MIDAAVAARLRRLYYAEHWRIGTIAAELGVHHDTVARALGRARRCGCEVTGASGNTRTSLVIEGPGISDGPIAALACD